MTSFDKPFRQPHTPATGLDASQCYDRMAHLPTAQSFIQHGGHAPAVHSMFKVLQNAEHSVTTAYGASKATYGGKPRIAQGKLPIQSIGQGNGAGPAGYIFLSSTCLRAMCRKGFVSTITGALSLLTLTMVCYLFVDDMSARTVASTPEERGEDLVDRAQARLDYWVGITGVTGAAINPEKSFWYLLDWDWVKHQGTWQWQPRSKKDMPGDLMANNLQGNRVNLSRLEPHQAEKNLGIYMAADGNMDHQIEYLKEKAQEFAGQVKRGPVTRNEAWTSYTHTIRKTLEYPMKVTTLTEQEWNQVFHLVNSAALPKAGFVQSFPHAVLYGPTDYQGMGTMHPFFLQELTHLQEFVDQVNKGSSCGTHFQFTTELLRLQTGHPGPFTEVDYPLMQSCVTDSWIKTLWEFCYTWGIEIEDSFGDLPLL